MFLPWVLCGILSAAVTILFVKICLLKKSIREISSGLTEHLSADTNTVISVSSADRQVRLFASELNKQLRILRRQRQLYMNGDRELKEAVTNISHDLRTPLTAVCGYLDLLENEEKSEDAARYLSVIGSRTQALKQLTEELFDYSVILSRSENIQLEPVNLNSILEESAAALYGALTEKGIEPVIHMPPKDVCRSLNRSALSRIFGNILNNALKHGDGDLEITLSENGEVIFVNTASELDEISVGKLFDRFFSVESARNSTGLGLSISKTLAEQMNGTVTAEYKDKKLFIHVMFAG